MINPISSYGFVKVCAAAPRIKVGDPDYNAEKIIDAIHSIYHEGAQIVLFPELSITGYTCGDLFQQNILLEKAEEALENIRIASKDIVVVVGLPIYENSRLWNVAAVICNQKILAFIPKTYLPSYKEYYECRWFHTGYEAQFFHNNIPVNPNIIFPFSVNNIAVNIGVEICEDLWMPIPPSSKLCLQGANLILNPSASTETIGKASYRRSLINQNSARNVCAYLYAASGPTESTSDVVFSGHCLASEYGTLLAESSLYDRYGSSIYAEFDFEKLTNERRKLTTFGDQASHVTQGTFLNKNSFNNRALGLTRSIDPNPFVPSASDKMKERTEEILAIQTQGLITRMEACGAQKIIIGVSGGLDSTLALIVAVKAMDEMDRPRADIVGITMPGFGTTNKTKDNAIRLMDQLGISQKEVSIVDACNQHFKDIGLSDTDRSITYENCQARERTQILMDTANMVNGIVLGTGDMSELALGFCTYNADHMSMYNVNCSVPKTLVKYLVERAADWDEFVACKETLLSICNTTISPELLPPDENGDIAQKTEDVVGPYELHDFFLYYHIRWNFTPMKIFYLAQIAFGGKYDDDTIYQWQRLFYKRFFAAQFKRNCVPDGPKVGSISLSPRGDWRMPSDASRAAWI